MADEEEQAADESTANRSGVRRVLDAIPLPGKLEKQLNTRNILTDTARYYNGNPKYARRILQRKR